MSVPAGHGIKVEKSVTVNRSPEEVYRFWRSFQNLPRFMNHLESVTDLGNNRSHWVYELDPDWKIYARLVREAAAAVAAENPRVRRLLGGISPISPDFVQRMRRLGALETLDVVAVPGFPLGWNEFIYALTFVSQSANKTAVVGVTADLIRGDIYYWGSLMAGAVLASVPIVVVYVWFLDYYVSGLTAGAVKG